MTDSVDSAREAPEPRKAEVREELERVLASTRFSSATRASAFLRYVVEQTLAGRQSQIKGFTIAIDVFERASDFDASADPIVRVEARRLRARLDAYYATEGCANPLRIDLPVGSYVPRFFYPLRAARPLPDRDWRVGRWAAGAAAIALGLSAFAVLSSVAMRARDANFLAGIDMQPAGKPVPRIAVEPFANLTGSPALDNFVAGLNEETRIRLGDFGVPVVVRTEMPVDMRNGAEGPGLVPEVRYVLGGSVRQQGGSVRISPRLVEAATGAQVWTVSFDERLELPRSVSMQERIGTRIAAVLANPFGPMYEREIGHALALPLDELDSYGCILQLRAYAQSLDRGAHERSRRCFLREISEQAPSAQLWAGLALIYQHEYWYGYNPQNDPRSALERAEAAARTALDIDDRNLLANLAIVSICYSINDREGFGMAMDESMSLASNPSVAAQIGFLLTMSGNAPMGRILLDEAIAAEPNVPHWYYVGLSFNAMLRDDYEQALELALQANAPGWFAVPMAEAAAAGLVGRSDIARHAIVHLLETSPDFASTGYDRLRIWIRDPRLIEEIVRGLKAGGLDICPNCATAG